MTRAVVLPTTNQVREGFERLVLRAHQAGKRPSVLQLAREFGLTNTTFRRHFPDIARELSEARRTPTPKTTNSPAADDHARLVARNARLRRDNQQLRQHIQLAVANIQRLTLEAHQLRAELESAANITPIHAKKS